MWVYRLRRCFQGSRTAKGNWSASRKRQKRRARSGSFLACCFLMPASAKQFLPFVREKFRAGQQYDDWYRRNGYAPRSTAQGSERVLRIRQNADSRRGHGKGIRPTAGRAQLTLGWDAVAISGELERTRSCAEDRPPANCGTQLAGPSRQIRGGLSAERFHIFFFNHEGKWIPTNPARWR